MRNFATGIFCVLAMAAASPALAGMDLKGVQVAAKAIGFAKPAASSGAKIAVVGSAATLSDVQTVLSSYTVYAGDGAGAYAAFVAAAAEAKAAGGKVLTIGNLACVEAGGCIIGIETSPKVTIYLSNTAAAAAGFDFDPNFKLLVVSK